MNKAALGMWQVVKKLGLHHITPILPSLILPFVSPADVADQALRSHCFNLCFIPTEVYSVFLSQKN